MGTEILCAGGLAALLAGIVGGGVKVGAIDIPGPVRPIPRVFLLLCGAFLILLCWKGDDKSQATAPESLSERAKAVLKGHWKGADEDCRYARTFRVKGNGIYVEVGGDQAGPPFSLNDVKGQTVKALGPDGTVTFVRSPDGLTYNAGNQGRQLEECP